MNFSFEGNYKPRRNINLGGIKKVEDKKSLMLKAQAERKAREQERQKLKSAQQIQVITRDTHLHSFTQFMNQAFYRGRKEAYIYRQQERTEFTRLLSPNNILTCTRQLLLFYTNYTDNSYAEEYISTLEPHLQNMFQTQDREQLDSWVWLTCLLIKKVLLPSMETR